MDLYNLYASDCMAYGAIRNRDYERFPMGTWEPPQNQTKGYYEKTQEKKRLTEQEKKQSCPFCQEQKRRPLGAYLKKRGYRKDSESIVEDEEAAEDRGAHNSNDKTCHNNK